jgi:hypothetical protein
MSYKHISAKRAWARISERAQLGEKFGYIACLGILYKSGFLTRAQVVERLNEGKICRADLVKFREHSSNSQSGPVCEGSGPQFVRNSQPKTHDQLEEIGGNGASPPETRSNVYELPLRP